MARTNQLAALPASDERAGEDLAGAARRLLGRGRGCVGEGREWEAVGSQTAKRLWRATWEVAGLLSGCCGADSWQSHRKKWAAATTTKEVGEGLLLDGERPMCHRPAGQEGGEGEHARVHLVSTPTHSRPIF